MDEDGGRNKGGSSRKDRRQGRGAGKDARSEGRVRPDGGEGGARGEARGSVCACEIFESAMDGIFVIDLKGRYRDVNPAGCRMFGYSREEFLESDIRLLLFPEDAERAFKGLSGDYPPSGVFYPEYRMRGKDGSEIWIDITVKPIEVGGERLLLGIKRDITKRMLSNRELKEEKDRARGYFDVAGVILLVLNADGTVGKINRRGCDLLGYEEREIVGKDWFANFLHPERAEYNRFVFSRIISGEVFPYEYVESAVLAKGGAERLIAWHNTVLRDAGGRVYAALSSGEDITERKRAEEELQRARMALEERVRERTADLVKANRALEAEVGERLRAEKLLRSIVKGTASVAGEEYFRSLVKNLAQALGLRYAVVAEVKGEHGDTISSLAVWEDGGFAGNFECPVANTPCDGLADREIRCYESGVKKLFPEACLMAEWGVESYIGVPLLDSRGASIGVLAAMDDKPMKKDPEMTAVLSIFGARASLELQRKRAEEERKRVTEMLQSIMDNSVSVIFLKDSDGRFVHINRRYETLFGRTREDTIGKNDYDIFPVEVADSLRANDRAILQANRPLEFEESVVHADGTVHTYISTKFPIPGMAGYVCGIATDITERKSAEEALKKSEERLKEAQRIAQIGSWEWDMVNDTTFRSDEIYRIFGLAPEGFGRTYEDFLKSIHPEDRVAVKAAVDRAVKNKSPFSMEFRIVLPDGTEKSIYEQAQVVYDNDGRAVRMTGIAQDITEMKRMEEEILKAQKLESIGDLAGGIAHDFNNLLLGVLGNVSIAKTLVQPNERVRAILDEIEKAALRTRSLTRQLLTFSRGGEPVREAVQIDQLIRDSAGLVLRGSDAECVYTFQKGLWPVNIDEAQISQVMNNILLNAMQAMPGGGVIEVRAENAELSGDGLPVKDGDYVRVSIKDHGAGIPKKIIHKVFDPFFTTKEKASGLGLAVSYSVVKKHGGHISVESRPGSWTEFTVYLPASRTGANTAAANGVVKGRGRILVMDDEELVRDVTGEMLTLLGYEAEFAASGEEAIELFRKSREAGAPFDAAILDLTVPGGMGGKEAVRRLLDIDPGFKAIVSSGYSKDPIMSDYRRYGFSGVIAKPYRVAEFSAVIKSVISGANTHE